MKRKLLCLFLCAVALLQMPAAAQAADYGLDVEIAAKADILICLDTDQIIYEHNADERLHPASTTKIMSVALALTLCEDPMNTMVTVPEDVWTEFDGLNVSSAGLMGGEQLSMYDLLCCMMLPSANEAASTLAAYYGTENFLSMMNDKAAELGCKNTHFSNPHGVFYDDHYTTARDLAIITKWAITVPGFLDIAQKYTYTVPATNMSEERVLNTTILMQNPASGYYTPYIKGVKTGTTDSAGRCLVTTASKGGMNFLLVVLGAPLEASTAVWGAGNSVFTETRLIYDWAFENLLIDRAVEQTTPVTEIPLQYAAKKDTLILYPAEDLFTAARRNAEHDPVITYELDVPERVRTPIDVGDVIGSATVLYNGEAMGTVDLVAREAVAFSEFAFLMDTLKMLLSSAVAKVIYVLLALFALFYLYYIFVVVPKARKRQQARRARQQAQKKKQDR